MAMLQVSRPTVYVWFNLWESVGLAGLTNTAGQDRRPIRTAADQAPIVAAVRANRQQIRDVTATLRQELAKDYSVRMLRRFLKSVVGRGDGSAIR